MSSERLFFTGMALLVLLCTFVGFAPSYYLRGIVPAAHPYEPLNGLVHAHGLVFTAWVLLFLVQTSLVAAGRVDLHRRLGLLGFALVALMIPLGLLVGVYGIGRPLTAPPGIDPRSWAALPLLDVPVFGGLIIAGLLNRRRPAVHKRLMLLAMINMLDPTLGRAFAMAGLPGIGVAIIIIGFVLVLAAWDRRMAGRVLPVTIWAGGVVIARQIITPLIWTTPAWMSFAAWLHSFA
jgi:hypothetical protein